MYEAIEALWSAGASGQPPRRVRQILLTNQVALFASAATVPYQLFFLILGVRAYLPVFGANLGFLAFYAGVLALNRVGRFDLARGAVLATIYAHLFVATYLLGTGAGVHLFYFSVGVVLALHFTVDLDARTLSLMAAAAALYLLCHFAFPSAGRPFAVPGAAGDALYAFSAVGALFLAGGFSYLFRVEIDRAERALTRTNRELERLSGVDPLTGLANRRALDAFLASQTAMLRRQGQQLSVVLFDVDRFKEYNDHYGHLAGDACLQRIAHALQECVSRRGDLVARYGGEEFVVVLPSTDLEGAIVVADHARAGVRAMQLSHARSPVAPMVTVSAGVVSAVQGNTRDPGELLRRADAALYHAKHEGRDRVVAWPNAATLTVSAEAG